MTAAQRLRDRLGIELADAILDALREQIAAVSQPQPQREWLTLAEAAEYLPVSQRTLERLVASGELRSARVERRRFIRREWLDSYAAAGEDVAPTPPPRRRASRARNPNHVSGGQHAR